MADLIPSEQRSTGAFQTPDADWDLDREYYWRLIYSTRPYVRPGQPFEYYEPGYRFAYESASVYRGLSWDAVQRDLERDWDNWQHRGGLHWQGVKDAVRDGWERVRGVH